MKQKILFFILSFLLIFSFSVVSESAVGNCTSKKTKMNVKKLKLVKNETYTLRVYNLRKKQTVKFTSDNEDVIAVSTNPARPKNATITAVNIGSANVSATIYNRNGKSVRTLKTNVKVSPFAISIKFTDQKVKLNVSDVIKLPVIIKPNISQEIPLYESSDTDVVTVNSKGVITAVSPGNATITATLLSSGQKASCSIHVVPAPSDFSDLELNKITAKTSELE